MMFLNSRAAILAIALSSTVASAKPVTAVLRLQERVAIETLAQNVKGAYSVRYARPYGPEEIRVISGPSDSAYNNLLATLRDQGFKIESESPTHLYISVSADSKVFESVFSTKLQTLASGRRRHLMVAQIPDALGLVATVNGLDSTRKSYPKFVRAQAASSTPGGVPQATIKTNYGFDPIYARGLSGAGQHIAIATYNGFNIGDVQQFYTMSNLNPMPTVDQVAFNGVAAYDENSSVETQLDAEFSGMIAPGASVHVFASATNDDAGELQMFTAILDDNRAKVANYSWGGCETQLSPSHKTEMQKVFARAVAQGVNIMVASGDSGSDSCQDGTTKADWPAANDNVVAVGGTSLNQKNGQFNETAWNGSGGGISAIWDLPSWQQNIGSPYVKRSYPDVAFNADPRTGQAVYAHTNGVAGWITIGGTSMAAPQWSGFMALVAEARERAGKGTLGYMPPIIYGMSSSDKASSFHDITSGSNGAYTAGPGWDAVTGLGSMNADALLSNLVGN